MLFGRGLFGRKTCRRCRRYPVTPNDPDKKLCEACYRQAQRA